jgi:hypothetical protein
MERQGSNMTKEGGGEEEERGDERVYEDVVEHSNTHTHARTRFFTPIYHVMERILVYP